MYHPTSESLQALESEEDDVDIDLIPLEEAKLEMTERAAEVCIIYIVHYFRQTQPALAIAIYSQTRKQPKRGTANSRRERWMSWLSVQNGTHKGTEAR